MIKDEERVFTIPGMVSANRTQKAAFQNFRSPMKNDGKFCKVMFRIHIDNTGGNGNLSNCMLLNNLLSLDPN